MRPFRGDPVDRVLGDSATLRGGWAAAEAVRAAAEEDARRSGNQQERAHPRRSHATRGPARGGARSAAARSLLGDALARYQWLGMTGRERQSRVRLRTLPSKPLPRPTTPLHAGLSERGASVLRLFSVGRSNR